MTRGQRVALGLVLTAAVALRVLYLAYQPSSGRFVDERYSFDNVRGVLLDRSLRPVRYYYPSPLVNLPPAAAVELSQALHHATGISWLQARDGGQFLPAAYIACRLLQAVYGTLAVWLAFLVGRRLHTPATGLLAAMMLAFMPWQIHASGYFKPDAMLVCTVLLAFLASLQALDSRRLLPWLWAGVAIALAMSAKLTGGLIALPLTVAVLVTGWGVWRRWLLLGAAGIAALATFVLLNPYWQLALKGIEWLQQDYAMRAAWQQMTRAEVPGRLIEAVTGTLVHGRVLGIATFAGLALLAARVLDRQAARKERAIAGMTLVFPLAFVVSYGLETAYFKPNQFLPVFAFTSLAVAWLLTSGWRAAVRRLPKLATPGVAVVVVAWLVASTLQVGAVYAYRSVTPSTLDEAKMFVQRRVAHAEGRSIYVEPGPVREPRWEGEFQVGGEAVAVWEVDRLADVAPAALDLADAEIFPEERLSGELGEPYRRRIERLKPSQVGVSRARLFAAHGPPMVTLTHRKLPYEPPREVPLSRCDSGTGSCFEGTLPGDLVAQERLSFVVWVPREVVPPEEPLPPFVVAGKARRLAVSRIGSAGRLAVSDRLVLAEPAAATVRLAGPGGGAKPVQVMVCRWVGGPHRRPLRPPAASDGRGNAPAEPAAAGRQSR